MSSTGPIPTMTANQLTRALGEAVIRIWSNLPQPTVGIQFPEPIGLQPISQNMKQQVAGQVRGRSPGTPCAISLAVPLYRDRADARSRCRAPLRPAPPDRSPRVAWRSSCPTARGAGRKPCTATVSDAIDPVPVDLLRAQFKAELLAHHPSEEAAHRMLLPMGDAHDGRNRRSLRPAQHAEHASLFRPWPAFARGAGFGLRLARRLLLLSLLPRRNGAPLTGGDDLGCRCFDFGSFGSRANACLHGSANRIVLDPDRFEALPGDAKRHGSSFSIASPRQEGAIGADLFQQPS